MYVEHMYGPMTQRKCMYVESKNDEEEKEDTRRSYQKERKKVYKPQAMRDFITCPNDSDKGLVER